MLEPFPATQEGIHELADAGASANQVATSLITLDSHL